MKHARLWSAVTKFAASVVQLLMPRRSSDSGQVHAQRVSLLLTSRQFTLDRTSLCPRKKTPIAFYVREDVCVAVDTGLTTIYRTLDVSGQHLKVLSLCPTRDYDGVLAALP